MFSNFALYEGIRNKKSGRFFEIPGGVDYIMAPPRMQKYIDYAAEIYEIYLKYIAKEDIHVYLIDEAFMDVTDYLGLYHMTGLVARIDEASRVIQIVNTKVRFDDILDIDVEI